MTNTYTTSKIKEGTSSVWVILLFLFIPIVCFGTIYALYKYSCYLQDPAPDTDISVISDKLDSFRSCIRSKAALDAQNLKTSGKELGPKLVKLLKDPDDAIRWRSVAAIGHICYFTEVSIRETYRLVSDPHENVKWNALFAMSMMSNCALMEGNDKNNDYQRTIQSEERFKAFLQALYDQAPRINYKALLHLEPQQILTHGTFFIGDFSGRLLDFFESPDERIRVLAIRNYLVLVGPKKAKSTKLDIQRVLTQLANSSDQEVKLSAKVSLHLLEGTSLAKGISLAAIGK